MNMVTSNKTLQLIKNIIERRYAVLLLSVIGEDALSEEEIKRLKSMGIKVSNNPSQIELAYFHSLLVPRGVEGPKSPEEMIEHQKKHSSKISGKEVEFARTHANEVMKVAIEKLKNDSMMRIMQLIQENNQNYKFNSINSVQQTEKVQQWIKESTIDQLKRKLRDTSGDANRDWKRVAITEVSNAIGMGAVDRVVSQNKDKAPDEIFVYRIPVVDAALCSKCREFYLDFDGSPKVYKLSTLLSNGSNYGKPKSDWNPVLGATHPHDRESGIIELKPGWRVLPGGRQTFIGQDKWKDYIVNKVIN